MKNISFLSNTLSGLNNSDRQLKLFYSQQIWRIEEVAEFLRVSVGHVYNLASRREIPFRKKGGKLFFFPSEILKWIDEGVKE
ncbi:MAG: helix-turn-helix domain-containing protein [Bdellovibrio sp.]|nr:helix-turn-helix domain-containing protein [Bdellovibrio sp.]